MWGQEIKWPQGNLEPPAVAAAFPWLSVTSLKTYVWSFNMSTNGGEKKTYCWKKLSSCVTKCIHMMKWDLRTVISNDSLAPLFPFFWFSQPDSKASPHRDQSLLAMQGWVSAGRQEVWVKPGHPLKAPVHAFSRAITEFLATACLRVNSALVRRCFRKQTLGCALQMEQPLSGSCQSSGGVTYWPGQ